MPHRARKILVIEDDPQVLKIMQLVLQRFHLTVTTAGSGEEGLALAEAGDFDLITLDINLPGIDGFEVCRQLKQHARSRHTPVIIVSAHILPGDERIRAAGATDALSKPFDVATLIGKVNEHLTPHHDPR